MIYFTLKVPLPGFHLWWCQVRGHGGLHKKLISFAHYRRKSKVGFERVPKRGCMDMGTEEKRMDIEKLLAEGNTVQVRPQGWSMYPLLVSDRDEVRIAPPDARRLKRGEVVLFRRLRTPEWNGKIATQTPKGQILVLHRIWRRKGNQFYMVGDNQKLVEGPLERSQIKGVMTGFIRNGRYHSVRSPLYRVYATIWLWLRPFRPVLSQTAGRLKRVLISVRGR